MQRGRPSKQFGYRRVGQRVELYQPPVVREKKGLALFFQSGHRHLAVAPLPGGLDGGVDAPQVHVCRKDKGHPAVHGVPVRGILRRGLIIGLEGRPRQPRPIVRHSHDLKLHGPGIVTGEQMHRQAERAVGRGIMDEFIVQRGISACKFGKHVGVAFTGK